MRTFIVMTFCCLILLNSFCYANDKIEWIDYLAIINKACKPKGALDSDNTKPLLNQASKLYVKPDKSIQEIAIVGLWSDNDLTHRYLTDKQVKKLKNWHKANQAGWRKFVEASNKENYWQEYEYVGKDHGNFEIEGNINVPVNELIGIGNISYLGASMARADIAEGNFKDAVEKCIAIIKVGCLVQYSNGCLFEQLVAASSCRLGYEQLLYVLDDADLNKEDILFIGKKLAQLQGAIKSVTSSDAENIYVRSFIQNIFSIDRSVRKNISYANLKKYDDVYGSFAALNNKEAVDLKKIARGHADFYEVMHVQGKLEERYSKLVAMRPYERSKLNLKDIVPKNEEAKYYLLTAYSIEGAPVRQYDLLKRTRLKHEAVAVVVSLKRWQFDKGSFPQKLNELVASGYIKRVPEDPFGAEKIKYKKKGKSFLLYSNGYNMKDDGGSREEDEAPQKKDLVFWPVANKNTSTKK